MKRSILTIVAAVAIALGAAAQSAQTQYVMQIKKTNGEIIPVNTDEIADVSFVSAQASVRTLLQQGLRNAAQAIAENMNLTGFKVLTGINQQLLQAIQNTPVFANNVKKLLNLAMVLNEKTVEEGSVLAQMGFETYSELSPELLRIRVLLNGNDGFSLGAAEATEIVFPAVIPTTSQAVTLTIRVKSVGENTQVVFPSIRNPKKAMIYYMPEMFEVAILADVDGQQMTIYTGQLKIRVKKAVENSPYANPLTDNLEVSGQFVSHIEGFEQFGLKDDKNVVSFNLGIDMQQKKQKVAFGFSQQDMALFSLDSETSFTEIPELIQMLLEGRLQELLETLDLGNALSTGGLSDIMAALISGRSLDKFTLNLHGHLEMNVSCSDNLTFLQRLKAQILAHHDTQSLEEVEEYCQVMNELLDINVKFTGTNQPEVTLPVEIRPQAIGMDYLALPAIKFPDEQDFTPVSDLLDTQTLLYCVNIVSHSISPVADAIKTTVAMVSTVLNLVFGEEEE